MFFLIYIFLILSFLNLLKFFKFAKIFFDAENFQEIFYCNVKSPGFYSCLIDQYFFSLFKTNAILVFQVFVHFKHF